MASVRVEKQQQETKTHIVEQARIYKKHNPNMNTRATARKQIPSTWRSAEADDIDQALSYLGVFYTENSRHEESHPFRNGCMDWNRNQTGGCSCVADLLVWKNGNEHNKWSDYALVCQEISDWFRSTGDLESRLAKLNKLGTKEFKESFARCIVLKKCTTGIFTKMVDLSVTPGIGVQSYNERTGLLIRHNAVVTTSTLCLNSARNLWIVLTGSEFGGNQSNPIFIDWKKKLRSHSTLVCSGARGCNHAKKTGVVLCQDGGFHGSAGRYDKNSVQEGHGTLQSKVRNNKQRSRESEMERNSQKTVEFALELKINSHFEIGYEVEFQPNNQIPC